MKLGTRVLNLMALVAGLAASGALFLASVADFWLYTSEPLPFKIPNSNVSGVVAVKLHSGLWRACVFIDGDTGGETIPTTCVNIGYTQVWGRVDGGDTTNSILRGIRRASPFVIIALLIMIAALSFSTLGNTKEDVKTLIGAVLYIFAALCLGLGMIFYISAVNDEVSRLKAPSSDDEQVFEYGYGWAVMCAGGSFISSMVAAVTDISIYLKRYPTLEDMVLIIPGLQKKSGFAMSVDDEDEEEEDEEDVYVEERCGSPYALGRRNNTVIL